MAVTAAQLFAPTQIPNAVTKVYQSAGSTRIDKFTVCNPSGSAATVSIFLVPEGGTTGDATTITKDHSLASKSTWNSPDPVGLVMNKGDTLYVSSDTDNALTVVAAGLTIE